MLLASVATLSVACSAPAPALTHRPATAAEPTIKATDSPLRSSGEPAYASQHGQPALRYVALGDSYTIGQGVKTRERWPNQLVRILGPVGGLNLVANLAVTGATTSDVIKGQLGKMDTDAPGFVSLLIGVNDVVQGASVSLYRQNLRIIIDHVLADVPPNRLILVTIPNYTLTPVGPQFGGRGAAATVAQFNVVMQSEAQAAGIVCVDITPAADQVANNESLVAGDGLHPSGRQYAAWVEFIVPSVRRLLSQPPESS